MRPARTVDPLVEALAAAGLTGRGGAAFSTAEKLAAARAHEADLVVNVCDGEPGAAKDAWVVAHRLEELLDGAALLAARRGTVWYAAHRGSATAARLSARGVPVLEVPARYVSSEESALVSLAHGGTARPLTKPVPPVTGSRDGAGRPLPATLVLNAETVWRVAQVQRLGAAWFRSHGTADEPGPRLVTIHGHVAHPGVLETAAGVPLASLLDAARVLTPGGAVLVGGLAGAFLTAGQARAVAWSTPDLARHGARTGAGVVEVLDPSLCPLVHVSRMLSYAAGESAGQCGPCMFGLPALSEDVAALVDRPDPLRLSRVRGRLDLLRDRGACRFPDGVSGLTASALDVFADHLDQHARGRCAPVPPRHHDRSHHAVVA